MGNQKLQSITWVLGIICLFLVVLGQLFKSEIFIPQTYLPYLTISSLALLSVSLYLKAKSGGLSHYHFPIKLILIFIAIVVVGIGLINYFTT